MVRNGMALSKELIGAIEHSVEERFQKWVSEFGGMRSVSEREMEIRERIVRVEESLERQSALMRQGFEQMEKRFEQMEKRFEQVDKRFEQVDKRFEQVDKRFEQVDKRFEELRDDMRTQFNRVYGFLTGLFIVVSGSFITMVIQMMR